MNDRTLQVLMTNSDAAQDLAMQLLLRRYGIDLHFFDPADSRILTRIHEPCTDAMVIRINSAEVGNAALLAQYHLHHHRSASILLPMPPAPFIGILSTPDPHAVQILRNAGYSAILYQPFSEYTLASAILQHTNSRHAFYADQERTLEIFYQEQLITLGCPMHLAGYRYLLRSLLFLSAHPEALHQMTKILYPRIAAEENTSAGCVERSMRTALEHIWPSGNRQLLDELLPTHAVAAAKNGSCGRRPSVSEFLAALLAHTTLQRKNG